MKTLILALAIALIGCASTTVYRDGKPIFRTQADMTAMEYSCAANGEMRWKAQSVNHSKPTIAGGNSVSKGILAGGTAVATSGLTNLIK